MFSRKIKLFFQCTGMATVALLTLYGGISAFRNAENLLSSAGLIDVASASPISLETQKFELQTSDAMTGTIPPYLNYQGTLRDVDGNLLTGEFDMTFRIYDNVLDPVTEPDWTESAQSVTVRNGSFSVLLGTNNPITDTTVFRTPTTFLGVTVNDFDEMMPRHRFASVPYAVKAHQANQLSNTNNMVSAYVDDQGLIHIQEGQRHEGNPEWGQGRVQWDNLLNKTWGQINRWTDRFEILSSDRINFATGNSANTKMTITNEGSVGIGIEPGAKLHVNGELAVENGAYVTNGVRVNNGGMYLNGGAEIENGGIVYRNAGHELQFATGFGTDIKSPNSQLHINTPYLQLNTIAGNTVFVGNGLEILNGGCTGCNFIIYGQNSGQLPLELGDIVSVRGISSSEVRSEQPVPMVTLTTERERAFGVVVSSAALLSAVDQSVSEQDPSSKNLVLTDGLAQPNDYVAIMVSGMAQVKVDNAHSIEPGTMLAVTSQSGRAQSTESIAQERTSVSFQLSTIGTMLENAEPGQNLAWVMVNPQ